MEQAITQIHKFKIVRRTSPYNKYIKWFAEQYREDGHQISSIGYHTEKEARQAIEHQNNSLFPIGNKLYKITMREIQS